jgi:hypothetical protein
MYFIWFCVLFCGFFSALFVYELTKNFHLSVMLFLSEFLFILAFDQLLLINANRIIKGLKKGEESEKEGE